MLGAVSLTSIRNVTNKVMASVTSELENNIPKRFTDFHSNIREDNQKTTWQNEIDINLKMEETTKKTEVVSQRLGEGEQRVGQAETFRIEVKETLNQMQRTQLELKSKLTELEGHSRLNIIRIYGIKEGAEDTSMICFVENLIQTELGEGKRTWY